MYWLHYGIALSLFLRISINESVSPRKISGSYSFTVIRFYANYIMVLFVIFANVFLWQLPRFPLFLFQAPNIIGMCI